MCTLLALPTQTSKKVFLFYRLFWFVQVLFRRFEDKELKNGLTGNRRIYSEIWAATQARGRVQLSPGRNESWPPATGNSSVQKKLWKSSVFCHLWFQLTVWWLVVLALQFVKLVHVRLLSGCRPHSPFSVHTLDATAGSTFKGHEVKEQTEKAQSEWVELASPTSLT